MQIRSRSTKTNDSISPNHSRRAWSLWHGDICFAKIEFCTAIIQACVEEEVRTESILRKTKPKNFTITLLICQIDEEHLAKSLGITVRCVWCDCLLELSWTVTGNSDHQFHFNIWLWLLRGECWCMSQHLLKHSFKGIVSGAGAEWSAKWFLCKYEHWSLIPSSPVRSWTQWCVFYDHQNWGGGNRRTF